MAGYAKEIHLVDESDEEIQRVLQEKDAQNTKSTKFAIQAFGDLQTAEESVENLDKRLQIFFMFSMNIFFGIIYQSPREISSLKEIFRRIPLAPGL